MLGLFLWAFVKKEPLMHQIFRGAEKQKMSRFNKALESITVEKALSLYNEGGIVRS